MIAGIEIENGLCDPDHANFRDGLSAVTYGSCMYTALAVTKETSVSTNLTKSRIADLSPLSAINGFVRSWPHLVHGSESPSQTVLWAVHPSYMAHERNQQTHRHTDHATLSVAIAASYALSACDTA